MEEYQRVAEVNDNILVLKRLSDFVLWESFRPLLNKGYTDERKRLVPLTLLKILGLLHLFNFRDEEVEFNVNHRRSFKEFVGQGVMNDISHTTTVIFFRKHLRKAQVSAPPKSTPVSSEA